MDILTYTVYHKESDKVVASDLNEEELLNLIGMMIYKEVVKDIWLTNYSHTPSGDIDIINLLVDIRKQGVFDFNYVWHVR